MHTEPIFPPDVTRLLNELAIARALEELGAAALWNLGSGADGTSMLYEPASGLLWQTAPSHDKKMELPAGQAAAAALADGGLQQWRVPTLSELQAFGRQPNASVRSLRSLGMRGEPAGSWLCTAGTWDFGAAALSEGPQHWGLLAAVNDFVADLEPAGVAALCVEKGWRLTDAGRDVLALVGAGSARALFADMDHAAARLPRLDSAFFDDPAGGLWELWGNDADGYSHEGLRARNPADDIRDWDVAIDFGTSSTVVAYNEDGRRKLLRIGIDRFWDDEQPASYENPTALEFLDLRSMLLAWRDRAYRPGVTWNDVRCSHAALDSIGDLKAMHGAVSRVMRGLKQWAQRGEADARLHLRDGRAHSHALAPLSARNPVRGIPLETGPDDPFDPIELYAWFIGMHINWRGRGIFLRYYMCFPVAYPEAVRDRILASFRRGLQRSLPATLVAQPAFADFRVEELASEPAAYAAAALPALEIAPSQEGVAYAVFDFGGGTTDFEFGKYRLPRADEDEEWEEVLEHWGAAGDVFLGGEHLLANMAYYVFRCNLDECERCGITFARPQDGAGFAGDEMFVNQSRIATTNSAILAAALRPVWEDSPGHEVGTLDLRMLDRGGVPVHVRLSIPGDQLDDYLAGRIGEGIRSFFLSMREAFRDDTGRVLHVLLAGNASRSRIVENFFFGGADSGLMIDADDFFDAAFDGAEQPDVIVHRAPEADVGRPATGKTGVALGLLRLCPGGTVVTTSRAGSDARREAPFAFHVGRIRRGRFEPVLRQGGAYGEWCDLGSPRERVLKLAFTRSPRALVGDLCEGAIELAQRRLEFGAEADGRRVVARAISPHEIEVGLAVSIETARDGAVDDLRILRLV